MKIVDYPALLEQVKVKASSKGYTELFDFLHNWCEMDYYNGAYTGRIDAFKWSSHCMDTVIKQNKPAPVLPFKVITAQARDIGVACAWPNKDFTPGRMSLRKYKPSL